MGRVLLLCCLALAGLVPAAEAATVKLTACEPALDPLARTATWTARARALPDSDRIQVRFSLQVREDGLGGWRRVLAGGSDEWLTSGPGVLRYTYDRTVQNLAAPASYRTIVRFRWLDAEGSVLDRARLVAGTCQQPDLRPDLVATRVDVARGTTDDVGLYAVTLRNDGREAAGAFGVALQVGETELDPIAVARLAAGAERVVTFTGPACLATASLLVGVDPDEAVDERDEEDNRLQARCPA